MQSLLRSFTAGFFLMISLCASAFAENRPRTSLGSLTVELPAGWTLTADEKMNAKFPFETYRLESEANRNSVLLVSIVGRDNVEFTNTTVLKRIILAECRPYLPSPEAVNSVEVKRFAAGAIVGFYANFIDPDLVGKPLQPGNHKTATPMILHLGSSHLIKATVLCEELTGADYATALQIIGSIQVAAP